MTLLEPFFTVLTGGENLIGKKICFCQGVVPWPPVSQLLVSLVRALTSHLSLGLRLPSRASAISSYNRKIPEGNCHFFNFIFAIV